MSRGEILSPLGTVFVLRHLPLATRSSGLVWNFLIFDHLDLFRISDPSTWLRTGFVLRICPLSVWRFIEPIGKIDALNLSPQPINIAKGRQR